MDSAQTKAPERDEVARLQGARLPADLGIPSLGLLMQLSGSLWLAFMSYLALMPIFAGASAVGWPLFLLGASGAVRAAFHRAAGTALIYGTPSGPSGPRKALTSYFVVSALETLVWIFALVKLGTPNSATFAIVCALAAWPVTLAVVLGRPRYRKILDSEDRPHGEDLGFEGAGVFMLVLGAMGTLFAGFMVFTMFKMPGSLLSSPQAWLLIGIFLMLLARSVLHTLAGFKATTGSAVADASDAAARYYSFGVVSSVVASAGLLILMMMTAFHPAGLLMVGIMLAMLLLWPLTLRRFYTEKNFAVLLAGSDGPVQRRAPDAGMTALGWILLGTGVFGLSMQLPQVLLGVNTSMLGMLGGTGLVEAAGPSPWWQIGVSGLQMWAGIELTQMTDRHRMAANAYGVIATAVTLFLFWPAVKSLSSMDGFAVLGGNAIFGMLGKWSTAISLVLPVVTVALANRSIMPQATARITAQPGPEPTA